MKHIFTLCAAVVAAGIFQSCLKEKECPPEAESFGFFAAVAEKNYDNVDEIPQAVPIDENLAFRSYVGVLDVRYHPASSGVPVLRTLVPQEGVKTAVLPTDIPDGPYNVLATGNAAPENFVGGDGYLLELHPEGKESSDTYFVKNGVTFPLGVDRTLSLQRTKGLLLLYYTTLPEQIARVTLLAAGIAKNVDAQFTYSGATSVAKDYMLPDTAEPGVLTLLLAPTDNNPSSTLTIRLANRAGNPVTVLSDIALPVSRNQITALELRYDPTGDWEIWISVEGVWIQVHRLTID